MTHCLTKRNLSEISLTGSEPAGLRNRAKSRFFFAMPDMAVTVLEQGMKGAIDPIVTKACGKEGRALVTLDTNFANIQNYRPSAHTGLVDGSRSPSRCCKVAQG